METGWAVDAPCSAPARFDSLHPHQACEQYPVPEPLVRGDLLRDKLAVVGLRQLMVGGERSESGAQVEPEWGGLETGRRAVARPAILFRARDHLGADRVDDNSSGRSRKEL